MRRISLVLVAMLLVIAACVALAPAGLADLVLRERTGEQLRFARTEGTLWKGSGEIIAVASTATNLGLGQALRWRLDPIGLLQREIRGELLETGVFPSATGQFAISGNSLRLEHAVFSSYIDSLSHLILPAGLMASGEVNVTIPAFTWSPPSSSGGAKISWSGASVIAVGLAAFSLGTVDIDVFAEGTSLKFEGRSLGGAVLATGRGEWSPGQALRLDMEMRAAPNADPAVESMLNTLIPADAAGTHRLQLAIPINAGTGPRTRHQPQ